MTALPRQDQLFDDLPDANSAAACSPESDQTHTAPDEQPTANGERLKPRAPVRQKSIPEIEREGVKRDYLQARGRPYKADVKDHAAWTELKKVAEISEIEAGWRIALAGTGYLQCNYIWQLAMKWNDIAAKMPRSPVGVLGRCAACDGPGECGLWRLTICYRCYAAWLEDDATTRALDAACAAEDYPRAHAVAMTWARERFTRTRSGT